MQGFRRVDSKGNPYGKPYFSEREHPAHPKHTNKCGQCVGCRLDHSRNWAIRCVHEAQMHDDNCFITLTYDDNHLPKNKSLVKEHFKRFIENLREKLARDDVRDYWYPKYKGIIKKSRLMKIARKRNKIRFYMCGEYGDKYKRPHYHAIIFGLDFKDKYLFKIENDQRLYRSPLLEKYWKYGHSSVGSATFESAAYVARYIMKKHKGKDAWIHYCEIDHDTGEIIGQREPEYTNMSRNPGVGKGWLDKYLADVYPSDKVVINGKEMKPPRYYDSHYEIQYPSDFQKLKERRRSDIKKFSSNNTPDRLKVREQVKLAQIKNLPRNLEI
jgi:hypothetical protein